MLNKHLVLVESRDSTRVKCLDFHPTLPILIGGNHCGTLNIHNYLYNTVLGLEEHSGSIRCIKIHPSGNLFATGGDLVIEKSIIYEMDEIMNHPLDGDLI